MEKFLKIVSWVMTIGALVCLWLSIRSATSQVMYGIIGLGLWGIGMLVNWLIKNELKRKKNK